LDLSEFAENHPGGTWLINYTLGRDISKFFYGGYALDGNSANPKSGNESHCHSNIARKIVNKYVIATLARDMPRMTAAMDHQSTFDINSVTKSFVFKV